MPILNIFYSDSEQLAAELPAAVEDRLIPCRYTVPPWRFTRVLDISTSLPGIKDRHNTVEKKMEAARKVIRQVNADLVVYTDGSDSGGNKDVSHSDHLWRPCSRCHHVDVSAATVITCGDHVADAIMKSVVACLKRIKRR